MPEMQPNRGCVPRLEEVEYVSVKRLSSEVADFGSLSTILRLHFRWRRGEDPTFRSITPGDTIESDRAPKRRDHFCRRQSYRQRGLRAVPAGHYGVP